MLELVLFGMFSLLLAMISLFGMEYGGEPARKLALLFSILSTIVNTLCLLTTIVQMASISMQTPSSLEELSMFLINGVSQLVMRVLLIVHETIFTALSYNILKQVLASTSMDISFL